METSERTMATATGMLMDFLAGPLLGNALGAKSGFWLARCKR